MGVEYYEVLFGGGIECRTKPLEIEALQEFRCEINDQRKAYYEVLYGGGTECHAKPLEIEAFREVKC